MKEGIFFVLLIMNSMAGITQRLYSWNVPAGNWTDAANWTPARVQPHAGDTLVFPDPARVSALPTSVTVAALYLSPAAKVEWTTAAPVTLRVTGGDTCLHVGPEAELLLTGPGSLQLFVQGVAAIEGAIYCRNGAHRLLPMSTSQDPEEESGESGLILFKSGSSFYAGLGFSGNPFGTTALHKVIFREGSTYVSIAGANPFGATAPASVVIFERGSVYRHQRSTAPQLSGRSYGYFEIAALSSYNIALSADCTIQNDLVVRQGQFVLKPSGGAGNIILKGNMDHRGTGDFQIGSNGSGWRGRLILDAGEGHTFRGTDSSAALKVDHLWVRQGNLLLEHPLIIGASLQLDSTIVKSGNHSLSPAMLTMEAGSQFIFPSTAYDLPHSTGYDAGYIEGSILWKGLRADTGFAFPTGFNKRSRPVIIHGVSGDVLVRLHTASPLTLGQLADNDSILLLDPGVYWEITGLQPGSTVEIGYNNIENWHFQASDYRIAHFAKNFWRNTVFAGVDREDGEDDFAVFPASGSAILTGTARGMYAGSDYFTVGSTKPLRTLNYIPPDYSRPIREENNDLLIYPNPVSEKLFIYFKNSRSKSKIDIVYITGAVVQSEEFVGERAVLDVSRLPGGMYFLQFRNKNLNRTQVFIKQ